MRVQKMRKTIAKMGGLSEDRHNDKKGRERRKGKVQGKGQQYDGSRALYNYMTSDQHHH